VVLFLKSKPTWIRNIVTVLPFYAYVLGPIKKA